MSNSLRWWDGHAGLVYSLVTGLAVASLALAMQSNSYRSWYKSAFKLSTFAGSLEYYAIFVWAPLWAPVLAVGAFEAIRSGKSMSKPREFVWFRKWLPSITWLEAVAYALIFAIPLVWFGLKTERSVEKYGWTMSAGMKIAEGLGIAAIPLLAFLLVPSHATQSVATWLHLTPVRALGYHKWGGAFAFVLVFAHGVSYFPLYYVMGGWEALRLVMFSGMTCKTKSKCIPAGLFAVLAAIISLFFATYWQRRKNWRRFRVFHILGALLFYLGAVAHWQKFIWYMVPGVALYMAKVACRLHQHCFDVEASVIVHDHILSSPRDVPEITQDPRPKSQAQGATTSDERVCLHIKLPPLPGHTHVGQWLGIGVGSGWRLIPPEIHPATIVSAPGEGAEICLLVRRGSAMGRSVLATRKRAKGEGVGPWVQRFKIKGPTGGIGPLDPATPTLFIAGGSGITPILALLNDERRALTSADVKVALRRVCWALRGTDTGCSLLKAVRGHLSAEGLKIHATAGHEEVERVLAGESEEEGEAKTSLGAYFLNLFPCCPPAPGTRNEVVPILAAVLGSVLGLSIGEYFGGNMKESLLEAEQGWAIGVVNLTYATVLSLACSFVSIFAYQFVRNVGAALRDHREGELLLTQCHHHPDLSMRSLGHSSALARSQSSSSSAADQVSIDLNGGEVRGAGDAAVVQGRPDFRKSLGEVFERIGPGGRVDVVVGGPVGMVKDVRKACDEHPLRSRIRLRECSFEL